MKSEKESPVISLGLWNQKETNEVRGYFEPRAGGEVKIFGFYYNKKRKKGKKEEGKPKVGCEGRLFKLTCMPAAVHKHCELF